MPCNVVFIDTPCKRLPGSLYVFWCFFCGFFFITEGHMAVWRLRRINSLIKSSQLNFLWIQFLKLTSASSNGVSSILQERLLTYMWAFVLNVYQLDAWTTRVVLSIRTGWKSQVLYTKWWSRYRREFHSCFITMVAIVIAIAYWEEHAFDGLGGIL